MRKVLIIRFSSFGDVLQCLSVAGAIARGWPESEIHWVTREDLSELVENHPSVRRVWKLRRDQGLWGLLKLCAQLRREKFTHVYDAHNNLRSRLIGWSLVGLLGWRRWVLGVRFLRRPIYRWRRFLLFRFRINRFEQPFNGQRDQLQPLRRWGLAVEAPEPPQLFIPARARDSMTAKAGSLLPKDFVALAPSAAFALKRWPLAYWKKLVELNPRIQFVALGGPDDTFINELVQVAPARVTNWAGKLSLLESAAVVAQSRLLVSNDTGLLHVAEQIGKPCIALMGPAPFGFPSRPLTRILEVQLSCRPCSKHGQGPCVNREVQKCLMDIRPEYVSGELARLLALPPAPSAEL